mmetsp:Transcript_8673/g.18537  ORF Transcript_8673/g.18537 Transcript_8673/m.18537 type:complete len:287 (-) Transcript_8673:30-890(-)
MSSKAPPTLLAWAGGIAGVIEAIAVQPLELVKVRFQLNTGRNTSIISCARDIIAEGGVLRLYRGLLPELVGMFPTRSTMYASNEIAKRFLLREGGKETAILAGAAGGFSGVAEAIVVTPFQVIKVRLQSKDHLGRYKNSFDCVSKIFREEGVGAFGIGMPATMYRNSVWNAVYFSSMFLMKENFPVQEQSNVKRTTHSLVTGFIGGVTATMCNAPFDVIKSRIQGQCPNKVQYSSTLQTLMVIGQTEGFGALYKGFTPKALRMGAGGAVAVTAFEAVCEIAVLMQL